MVLPTYFTLAYPLFDQRSGQGATLTSASRGLSVHMLPRCFAYSRLISVPVTGYYISIKSSMVICSRQVSSSHVAVARTASKER